MTDREPFAVVKPYGILVGHVKIVTLGDCIKDAEDINAAHEAAVKKAVEEFREIAAKLVEEETIPFTGDEPLYWREHASFLSSKAKGIRTLPTEPGKGE